MTSIAADTAGDDTFERKRKEGEWNAEMEA